MKPLLERESGTGPPWGDAVLSLFLSLKTHRDNLLRPRRVELEVGRLVRVGQDAEGQVEGERGHWRGKQEQREARCVTARALPGNCWPHSR